MGNFVKKGNIYILHEDYAEIIVISKKHGKKSILIDKEDVELCSKYTWGIYYAKNTKTFYASTSFVKPKRTSTQIHRVIMGNPQNLFIDHINHDTLDNRKYNLRAVSPRVNNWNKKGACKNNVLGKRNIRYVEKLKKYIVRVQQKHIGCYSSLEEAENAASVARSIHSCNQQ